MEKRIMFHRVMYLFMGDNVWIPWGTLGTGTRRKSMIQSYVEKVLQDIKIKISTGCTKTTTTQGTIIIKKQGV
jgi:hypothetical protein